MNDSPTHLMQIRLSFDGFNALNYFIERQEIDKFKMAFSVGDIFGLRAVGTALNAPKVFIRLDLVKWYHFV